MKASRIPLAVTLLALLPTLGQAQVLVATTQARGRYARLGGELGVSWALDMCGNEWKNFSKATPQSACNARGMAQLAAAQAANTDRTQVLAYTATVGTPTCGSCLPEGGTCFQCTVKIFGTERAKIVSTPLFVVQSINYALPGNQSYVSYTNETGRGSTWSTTSSAGANVSVGLSSILSGLTVDPSFKVTNSTQVSTKSTATGTSAFPGYDDTADYLKDEFVLWLNPTLTKYTGCGAPDYYEYGAGSGGRTFLPPGQDPTKPIFERFTAREIITPSVVTDEWKRQFLDQVALQDPYETILKLDPRITSFGGANPAPYLEPKRFRPVDSTGACPQTFAGVRLRGPLDCQIKYTYSKETSSTFDWSVNAKIPLFGSTSLGLSYSYGSTFKTENSLSNTAVLHLDTSSTGVCISGQMYMDTMFNTYLINSTTTSCP